MHLHPILTLWLGERSRRLGSTVYRPRAPQGCKKPLVHFEFCALHRGLSREETQRNGRFGVNLTPALVSIDLRPKLARELLLYQCLAVRFGDSSETPTNIKKKSLPIPAN